MASPTIKPISAQTTWPIRHQVMWPEKELDYVKLDKDAEGHHFGLFLGNELTAVVSVFCTTNQAQFRKLATLVTEQGKGYGSTLLRYVFDDLKQKGITRIWCNARSDKMVFYKRFGMTETPTRFDRDGISYIIMEWRNDGSQ